MGDAKRHREYGCVQEYGSVWEETGHPSSPIPHPFSPSCSNR